MPDRPMGHNIVVFQTKEYIFLLKLKQDKDALFYLCSITTATLSISVMHCVGF